jgi:hypothetical protein
MRKLSGYLRTWIKMEDKLFISQPRINKGIGSVRESEIRKVRLPFDEFGKFTSTEFTWKGHEIVITSWYKQIN